VSFFEIKQNEYSDISEEDSTMNRKTALSLVLMTLFAADLAFASSPFDEQAPQSSVDICVAEVANNADYAGANNVSHTVASKPRSISGYKVSIRTIVYDDDDGTVIREYASNCAINRLEQIHTFRIRQKRAD
jgi:hypothetical protein